MATTVRIEEAAVETYPEAATFEGPLSGVGEKLLRTAWERIESYITQRWTSRACTFVVKGSGDWEPPRHPFTATTIEIWADDVWEPVTVPVSPLGGFILRDEGPYRFVGTVGDGSTPPRAVMEAVFRLAEYFGAAHSIPADQRVATRTSVAEHADDYGVIPGNLVPTTEREFANPTFLARALQNSGAADLLRPYRRLGAS
ncbi:MAG: hypothetical protein AAF850_03695 [Pseudomonadota bacterium]